MSNFTVPVRLGHTPILKGEPKFKLKSRPPKFIRAWRIGGRTITNVEQRYIFHSPDGFEWGYGGSGPADFALNILVLFVDISTAFWLHQNFKWEFVARLPTEGGDIPGEKILEWIRRQRPDGMDGREVK